VAYSVGLKSAIETTAPFWCFFVRETWLLWHIPQEGHWEISYCGMKTKNYCGETENGQRRELRYEVPCNISVIVFLNEFVIYYSFLST
jgi:hypothetical protein